MFSVAITPTTNSQVQNHWSYVLSHWQPAKIYLIGSTDYGMMSYIPFRDATLVSTLEEVPGPLVVSSPKDARYWPGNISLYDFQHPEDCTYFFGSDNVHLSEVEMGNSSPDAMVYVPTDTKDEMYSFVAAAVILAHRRGQLGQPDNG